MTRFTSLLSSVGTVTGYVLSALLFCSPSFAQSYDCTAQNEVPVAECEALVVLYTSTDAANWTNNSGWLDPGTPIPQWHGVTVSGSSVTALNLNDNSLSGSIPPELGQLTSLLHLWLEGNSLSGSIPPELGQLTSLLHLWLEGNSLSGSIPPELGQLSNLQNLNLDGNNVSGAIPPELGQLSNLQGLSLAGNSLSGSLPPELGQLSNLRGVRLMFNNLSGKVPPELGQLANLQYLYFQGNDLSGTIPPELGQLTSLLHLWLNNNSLSGTVPPELGQLANLQYLYLSRNSLSGAIPLSFSNLLSLDNFYFDNTNLCEPQDADFQAWLDGITDLRSTGSTCEGGTFRCADQDQVPTSECEALVALYTSTDGANWTNNSGWLDPGTPIPQWHGVAVSGGDVEGLDLNDNNLSGSLPPELGQLSKLRALRLHRNSLDGSIPPELGQLTRLEDLNLFRNNLSGSIPPELGELRDLESLGLTNNQLTGTIPPELGQLTSLGALSLNLNNLGGEIPPELGQLTLLGDLRLNDNNLSGPLPPELGQLTSLRILYIGGNPLSGALPNTLTNLTAIHTFWFNETDLCEPQDPAFQAWLDGITDLRSTGSTCDGGTFNCADQDEVPTSECEALVALYEATGGDDWTNASGWLNRGTPLSQWYGVTVTGSNVTSVNLKDNSLEGSMPPELGQLTELENLDLDLNRLRGTIPPELGQLMDLQRLSLNFNNLSGSLPPELGHLNYLQELSLSNNDLKGPIPPEVGQLTNLRQLTFYRNTISGTIPATLGNLANLQHLSLSDNDLSGSLPPALGQLSTLLQLSVSDNALTGSVPSELGELVNMRYFHLDGNPLNGALPNTLTNLTTVRQFYFHQTNLCEPREPAFHAWLSLVADVRSTDQLCDGPSTASETHSTGSRRLSVLNNGAIGRDFVDQVGSGFEVDGVDALFDGNVFLATGPDRVVGTLSSSLQSDPFVPITGISDGPPHPDVPGFDQAYVAQFSDLLAPDPLGVMVTQRSYATTLDPDDSYIVLVYDITNSSSTPLNSLYVGIGMDWDVNQYNNNVTRYDASLRLSYTFDPDAEAPYFGIVALSNAVSGQSALPSGTQQDDARLFSALTTFEASLEEPTDTRNVLGTGPYRLDPDETATVQFAIVGGGTLTELQESADRALATWTNTPPVAEADTATTTTGSAITIDVLTNDSDDGTLDPASVAVTTAPSHGEAAPDPASGTITYTPATGFTGTDTFAYTVQDDGGLNSNEATVTVTVDENTAAEGEQPPALRLTGAFPNPFATRTELRITLDRPQAVRAAVFDLMGRRVRTLFEGSLPAARAQRLVVEGDGLPSGLYVIRVQGEHFTKVRRVLLVR